MVKGDADDLESLKTAFKGAYGVFCVSFFIEHWDFEKEKQSIKNMAIACSENSVKHAVWSTLENTMDALRDKAPLIKGNLNYFTIL